MGGAHVNQIMSLWNQLVMAAETLVREENLSVMLMPTLLKDVDEQL